MQRLGSLAPCFLLLLPHPVAANDYSSTDVVWAGGFFVLLMLCVLAMVTCPPNCSFESDRKPVHVIHHLIEHTPRGRGRGSSWPPEDGDTERGY